MIKNKDSIALYPKVALAIIGFLAIFILFSYSRDAVAKYAWDKNYSPYLALLLVKKDVALAMELGDHYFGGQRALGGRNDGTIYDLAKAKLAYEIASKTSDSPLWAHYKLARVYFVEGKFNDALKEINEEQKLYPENLRTLYIRGLIYGFRGEEGDMERAESDFSKFISFAPLEWAGYNDLAWVLMNQNKYKEAKEISDKGIENAFEGEKNPWLWNSKGVAELNMKEKKQAVYAFEKALQFAQKLTLKDWSKAYSGNSPESGEDGIEQFKNGIEKNLAKAKNL